MIRELAALNRTVLALAPRHIARPVAPSTDCELAAHLSQCPDTISVWDGASDRTVYQDATVNHAYRAWHDTLHVMPHRGFTLQGEHRVMLAQCRALLSLHGLNDVTAQWCHLLHCEVTGQVGAFFATGRFPIDQIAFTARWLDGATHCRIDTIPGL